MRTQSDPQAPTQPTTVQPPPTTEPSISLGQATATCPRCGGKMSGDHEICGNCAMFEP